jgi:hypothetical protein
MQFEGQWFISFKVIDWKPFLPTKINVTLTPKSLGAATCQDQCTNEVCGPKAHELSSY